FIRICFGFRVSDFALRSAHVLVLFTAPATLGAAPPAPSERATPYSVHWQPDPARSDQFTVEVSGLSVPILNGLRRADWPLPRWQRLLSVYAEDPDLA